MIETILLQIQRVDTPWTLIGGLIAIILLFFIIREVIAWFWKINTLIDTQEDILMVLEDIRDLLNEGAYEGQEAKEKETVNEMLEKKPKKASGEKDTTKNPPKK